MDRRIYVITGIIMLALGAVFVAFASAPAIIPGGVPTGPLEFGGKGIQGINGLELLLGAMIIICGSLLWKFHPRHVSILALGIILVLFSSAFATLSSFKSNLILTGIEVTLQYGVKDQGDFGATQQMLPIISYTNQSDQNLTVDEGSSFNLAFSLQESPQASGSDAITSIKATTAIAGFAFQILSVSPTLPIKFSPERSVIFKLALTAPFYSTGQSCPPQYCYHGSYKGPILLVLTTNDG